MLAAIPSARVSVFAGVSVDVGKCLSAGVQHLVAAFDAFDFPGRWEAAWHRDVLRRSVGFGRRPFWNLRGGRVQRRAPSGALHQGCMESPPLRESCMLVPLSWMLLPVLESKHGERSGTEKDHKGEESGSVVGAIRPTKNRD